MLKVLAKDGFSLSKRAIMNVEGPPSIWGLHWSRYLLPELEYRLICTSNGTCKGYERKPNIFWPLPETDDEYSMTDICLSCRFDVELAWFLIHFCFIKVRKILGLPLERQKVAFVTKVLN